ncbi:hypothetical protein ACH4S9_37280 [Streptomyces sp. NPDC021225]|uniref:hypothetical protein n=1 Tax=Streptomyces sp. NPDC021225 TaxID=3365121 RepID=UPI0037B00564
MTDALATHLRALRVRAGDPPIREIERLINTQGRRETMARSTIQDKFSGKSRATLIQALSIVEALSDYARSMGAPLESTETDVRVWRERVSIRDKSNETGAPTNSPATPATEIEWDITPLKRAGMLDVVEMIESSRHLEVADWLPQVVSIIRQAGMNYNKFLKSAARDTPQGIAMTTSAIHNLFPADAHPWDVSPNDTCTVANSLIRLSSTLHSPKKAPVILVALRRAEVGQYAGEFLYAVAAYRNPQNIERSVDALRSAELARDAKSLLTWVGSNRAADRSLEVLNQFQEGAREADVNDILIGVAKESSNRFTAIIKELQKVEHAHTSEYLDVMMRHIPLSQREEYADCLASLGYEERSASIRPVAFNEYSDEPPF